MKYPKELKIKVTKRDVYASVANLLAAGHPTTTGCLGAMCGTRALHEHFGPDMAIDVRYSKDLVTTRRGAAIKSQHWLKSTTAKSIDTQFDEVYKKTVEKFGNPIVWEDNSEEIMAFLKDNLINLVGNEIVLTQYNPKRAVSGGLNSHTHDEKGKATGGHKKRKLCNTRTKSIAAITLVAAQVKV